MAAEAEATVRPQRPPRLQHRLLLPIALLLALGALQNWIDTERDTERALREFIGTQDQLAREVGTASIRAAGGERAALAELDRLTRTAEARSETFDTTNAADRALAGVVREQWRRLRRSMADLRLAQARRDAAEGDSRRVDELGAALLLRGDELLAVMAAAEETPERLRAAGRQLVLSQRMAEAARQALLGEGDVLVMADRLGRDAVLFGEVNNALVNGDPRLGLARVDSEAAHDIVLAIGDIYREFAHLIERVMDDAVALYESRDAGAATYAASRHLLATLADAREARNALADERSTALRLRELLAALTLVALLGVALSLLRDRRLRVARELHLLATARQADERYQALRTQGEALAAARLETAAAMRRTLEAVQAGDLGARCEVEWARWRDLDSDALDNERETLAALNRTLQALIERLAETRRTSRDVVRAIETAHESARQVVAVGQEQADSLASVTPLLDAECEGLEQQAEGAARIARVARESASRSRAAADVTAEAHARALQAHEQLGVAVRLASHLQERGLELRELVRLLDDVADEGRILALNAAIHASLSRAGEPGGEAVSQAVQRLADGIARVERRAGALAEALERSGTECVDGLRRAASGISGSVQLAAVASERSLETAGDSQQLAERGAAHAAACGSLVASGAQRHEGVQRIGQLAAVLQQAASDSDQQLHRARELLELLSAHLAALRLPSHADANVVDLRDFIQRT